MSHGLSPVADLRHKFTRPNTPRSKKKGNASSRYDMKRSVKIYITWLLFTRHGSGVISIDGACCHRLSTFAFIECRYRSSNIHNVLFSKTLMERQKNKIFVQKIRISKAVT